MRCGRRGRRYGCENHQDRLGPDELRSLIKKWEDLPDSYAASVEDANATEFDKSGREA